MSDEKKTPEAKPGKEQAPAVPAPQAASENTGEVTPKAAAELTRAERKAAKVKAKADAQIEKIRAKDAKARQKAEAKAARKKPAEAPETAKPEPAKPAETKAEASKPDAVKPAEVKAEPAKAEVKKPEPAKDVEAAAAKPAAAKKPEAVKPAEAKTEPAKAEAKKPEPAKSTDAAAVKPADAKPELAKAEAAKPAEVEAVKKPEAKNPAEDEPAAATAAKPAGAKPEPAKAEAAKPAEVEAVKKPEAKKPAESKAEPAKAAAAATVAAKAETAEPAEKAEPRNTKAERRRRKLDKAHETLLKENGQAPARKKTGAVLLSTVAVVAAAAAVAAGQYFAPESEPAALPASVTSLPAGDALSVCAGAPKLLKGVDGTDAQFEPGAKEISTSLRSVVLSDLAKRVPGASFSKMDGSDVKEQSSRLDEEEAAQARGAADDGLTGRTAKVGTVDKLDTEQVFNLQPLGQLPSWGSAMRSYQAKDGDLAGLAAMSCQAPASNWRFTGLQSTAGSTSVLHLANPTHTPAQASIQLRGPDGLIDTSTLQDLVVAPGESRTVVLGGYAVGLDSFSANVTSVGGKITAYVQQGALRGLTPSGVDLVAANASATTTQVIPGVWIGSKENRDKLAAADASLVPQLHVAATGSSGAGFTVKVLGKDGEVSASLGENLAVASDATALVPLDSLPAGTYAIVVEADQPVTATVRMVRGADPKNPSDMAWAASSETLSGSQAMPLPANGQAQFALAAVQADSSVDAVVIDKNGTMHDAQTLDIKAGSNIMFDPAKVSKDAQAVLFSTDSNAYISQVITSSDMSLGWAAMPQANSGREGIVVNVGR